MKLLAFGASSSKDSINKKLAFYAASCVKDAQIDLIDLNEFELPIYSVDKEKEMGTPTIIKTFLEKINHADAIIMSLAEHNGSYTTAYKNLFDWASRSAKKVFDNKKVIILSTSPGPGGAKSVLTNAVGSMPYFGAIVIGSLSVPSFYDNFDLEKSCLKNADLNTQLQDILKKL